MYLFVLILYRTRLTKHMSKPEHCAVALLITNESGYPLIIKRPETDPELGGLWGLPALAHDCEADQREIARQVGTRKLGIEVVVAEKIGEQTLDRGGYILRLADFRATITSGEPRVPQADKSVIQYTAWKYANDPSILCVSALKGSACSRIYLDSIGINWRKDMKIK